MLRVLVLEDNLNWHKMWGSSLDIGEHGVELISTTTIQKFREEFSSNPDVDVIVLDACVPGMQPNTLDLAREVRSKFTGIMIAISSDKYHREDLMKAGCDIECEKYLLPQKIMDLYRNL